MRALLLLALFWTSSLAQRTLPYQLLVVAGREGDDSNPQADVELVDLSFSPPRPCFKPQDIPYIAYDSVGGLLSPPLGPLICGGGDDNTTQCFSYDLGRDQWLQQADMVQGRSDAAAVVSSPRLPDGTFFIAGGVGQTGEEVPVDSTETYDDFEAEFTLNDLPLPGGAVEEEVLLLANGGETLYMYGGNPLETGGNRLWRTGVDGGEFDWEELPGSVANREDAYIGLVDTENGQEILVAGGFNRELFAALNSSEIFNPSTNEWRPGPDLPLVMAGGSSVQLDGEGTFLIVGGVERPWDQDPPDPLASARILIYDTEEGEFAYLDQTLVTPRKDHTTVLMPADTVPCN